MSTKRDYGDRLREKLLAMAKRWKADGFDRINVMFPEYVLGQVRGESESGHPLRLRVKALIVKHRSRGTRAQRRDPEKLVLLEDAEHAGVPIVELIEAVL